MFKRAIDWLKTPFYGVPRIFPLLAALVLLLGLLASLV